MKRITSLVVLLVGLACVGTAPAGAAEAPDRAAAAVVAQTGQLGETVPSAGLTKGGHTIAPAKGLRTWAQADGVGLRLVAELTSGHSDGVFENLVPKGWTMTPTQDGTLDIANEDGVKQGRVERPWAVDAEGKKLQTRFVVEGRSLRQVVDAEGAAFPIVMDPWVTAGWWYYTPVYYVEMSWSETWKLKNFMDSNSSQIPGLLCAFLPTAAATVTCGVIYLLVKDDVKNTVNTAIRLKKCYKARVPASGGAASLPAYDSYYKTCRA